MATVTVTANSWNIRPTMPLINSSGMNTATSEIEIDRMVKPISPAPSKRRLHRRLAHLDMAGDVLDHDDRVIDDEADRDRQTHQRQIIQAVAEDIHHTERADDRYRHRDRPG